MRLVFINAPTAKAIQIDHEVVDGTQATYMLRIKRNHSFHLRTVKLRQTGALPRSRKYAPKLLSGLAAPNANSLAYM